SSDRLFLDRVARQHCPSPLHRHAQTTTPPIPARRKPDISTLQGIGHFYFALTTWKRRERNLLALHLAGEAAVGVNEIGRREKHARNKPDQAHLQAVASGGRVVDGERKCR